MPGLLTTDVIEQHGCAIAVRPTTYEQRQKSDFGLATLASPALDNPLDNLFLTALLAP